MPGSRPRLFGPALFLLLGAVLLPACGGEKLGQLFPALAFDCAASGDVQGLPATNAQCAAIDFGDVPIGTSAIRTIRFANLGRASLRIAHGGLATDLGAVLTAGPPPTGIESDATKVVTITFTPDTLGAMQDSYLLDTNDPRTPHIQIDIRGNGVGHPVLAVAPQTIDFGNVMERTTAGQVLTISNNGNIPMVVSGTLQPTASPFASTLPDGTVIAPGQSVEATIQFTPAQPGEAQASLTLSADASANGQPAGTDQMTITVPLSGRSLPAIEEGPAALDFGQLSWNSTNTETIAVSNTGKADLIIAGITLTTGSSPAFSITTDPATAAVIAPGMTVMTAVSVTYAPPSTTAPVSSDTGTVEIASNDPAHPTLDVPLTGGCKCSPPGPVIQVSPATIDFDTAGTPMDRTATVTVTNIGGAPLNVNQVQLAPGTPTDYTLGMLPAANTLLAPQQSTTFTVTYRGHPSTTPMAPVTGTVQVLSNDPRTPIATVQLTGVCSTAFGGAPDGDGDGIPDACDPCLYDGPTPPPLPNTITGAGITLSNGKLNGGGNILTSVAAGSSIQVNYDWQVTTGPNCGYCPGCITQYYVTADGSPSADCLESSEPCYDGPTGGSNQDAIIAPTQPGTYYVGFNWSWEYSCLPSKYAGHVGVGRAIGAFCVK